MVRVTVTSESDCHLHLMGVFQFGGKAGAVHEFYREYTNGKTTPPFRPIRVFVKNSWTASCTDSYERLPSVCPKSEMHPRPFHFPQKCVIVEFAME